MSTKIYMVLLFIIGGLVILRFTAPAEADPAVSGVKNKTPEQTNGLEPVTRTMGVVDVEASPAQVTSGKEVMITMAFNNHSVDLDYDFVNMATLRDSDGNRYRATKWTGGRGGHHVNGTLIFEPLKVSSGELTMMLQGIDNQVADFRWKM